MSSRTAARCLAQLAKAVQNPTWQARACVPPGPQGALRLLPFSARPFVSAAELNAVAPGCSTRPDGRPPSSALRLRGASFGGSDATPAGVRWLHSSPCQCGDPGKRRTTIDESSGASPKDCDDIVQELRYRNIRVPSALDISWFRRLEFAVQYVSGTVSGTLKIFTSVPTALRAASSMSLKEWGVKLSGWWQALKHEAHHYWVGFSLFGFELRVASRLVWKQLKGKTLTRRERKQLMRTTADLFRMVPFTLFIVIPFAEFLLPFALRIFPNMLPSTFQTQLKQEEDMKKLLKLKTELARFLQETVAEVAKDVKQSSTGMTASDAKALYNFLADVRKGGNVNNQDILRFARLFNDELTLDSLDRVHLVTLCQFLGLNHLGTEWFLRARLRTRLNELKADDVEIRQEGLDELTDEELRSACRARGMPAPFGHGSREFMRRQLEDWMQLSLEKSIPASLLLLSRAFKLDTAVRKSLSSSEAAAAEALKQTLNILPGEVVEDVRMENYKSDASPATRLEYLRRKEEDIKEEAAEVGGHDVEGHMVDEQVSQDRLRATLRATAKAMVQQAAAQAAREYLDEKGLPLDGQSSDEQLYRAARAREHRLRNIVTSLAALASASGVSQERALFMEVARAEVEPALGHALHEAGGSYLTFHNGLVHSMRPRQEELLSDYITSAVSKRVHSMLIRLEEDLDAADSRIGGKLHLLDTDNDGKISKAELQEALGFLRDELTAEEMAVFEDLLQGKDEIGLQELAEIPLKASGSTAGSDTPQAAK